MIMLLLKVFFNYLKERKYGGKYTLQGKMQGMIFFITSNCSIIQNESMVITIYCRQSISKSNKNGNGKPSNFHGAIQWAQAKALRKRIHCSIEEIFTLNQFI